MYCRIYEPGKTIVAYGQNITEMYFISKGNVIFFDETGVTPFLQLPQFSFFGEYQMMFNLRANYTIKVGGRVDMNKQTLKQDRTFFLCVSQEIFNKMMN